MPQIPATTLLPALRLSIGLGGWAAPSLVAKSFGFRCDAQDAYVLRLFASRDVALAAGSLVGPAKSRRMWWQIGLACDTADAAASIIGLREGGPKLGMTLATAVAVGAAGLGVAALLSDPKAA
ncbi:MAG TPA: hypothetical protein VFN48_03545 [Solirubrobacteraceae bacterium]|nr:hypothetical protein [Solirubrobacteraceae bacterium]